DTMSVMEYEAKFTELEKFAPHICDSDRRRAAKFVRGLKGYIRTRIIAQNHQTLGEAVKAAYIQEDEQEMFLKEKRVAQKAGISSDTIVDRKRKFGQSSAPQLTVRQPVTSAPLVPPIPS